MALSGTELGHALCRVGNGSSRETSDDGKDAQVNSGRGLFRRSMEVQLKSKQDSEVLNLGVASWCRSWCVCADMYTLVVHFLLPPAIPPRETQHCAAEVATMAPTTGRQCHVLPRARARAREAQNSAPPGDKGCLVGWIKHLNEEQAVLRKLTLPRKQGQNVISRCAAAPRERRLWKT